MLGSGSPVALQCRNTSLSASADTLAAVTVVIWGFIPPLSAPNNHGKGGAAVGRLELIRPATETHLQKENYVSNTNSINMAYFPFQHMAFIFWVVNLPPTGHRTAY